MEKTKNNRYIKIEALCDQCPDIHEVLGKAGISSVLTKQLDEKQGYEISVNFLGINSKEELLNLIVMMLQGSFKQAPDVMLQAMEIFMRTPGVAQAVMLKRQAAMGNSISGNHKTKLEGIN